MHACVNGLSSLDRILRISQNPRIFCVATAANIAPIMGLISLTATPCGWADEEAVYSSSSLFGSRQRGEAGAGFPRKPPMPIN